MFVHTYTFNDSIILIAHKISSSIILFLIIPVDTLSQIFRILEGRD